jgi:flagellar basal body-associated protein FliL
MNIEIILGVALIIVAVVILYFSAVGIALMWILKQAQQISEKDKPKNARKS